MSPSHGARSGWTGAFRSGPSRRPHLPGRIGAAAPRARVTRVTTAATAVGAALVAVLAACTAPPPAAPSGPTDGAAAVQQLGQVPIPTAGNTTSVPTASPDHPQLLAIGASVRVTLPGGVAATVTALGPEVTLPSAGPQPPTAAAGTITITAADAAAPLTLNAADFTSRDQTGQDVALAAVGPATVTASDGHPATLRLTGTFHAGAAQITWQSGGTAIAVWDFNIELD